MDPFSIIVGSASLIDLTIRVGRFLKEIHSAAENIGEDIISLSREIQALDMVNNSIQHLHEVEIGGLQGDRDVSDETRKKWNNTSQILQDCQTTVRRLEAVLEKIVGVEGALVLGRRDSIKKYLRMKSKDNDLIQIRRQLATHRDILQLSLTALDMFVTPNSD